MKGHCRQCSVLLSGEDSLDLAGLKKKDPDLTCRTTCDGCGFIAVNENGRCLTHKTHLQFFPHLTKGVEISPGFLEAIDEVVTDPIVAFPVPFPGSGFVCSRIPRPEVKENETE